MPSNCCTRNDGCGTSQRAGCLGCTNTKHASVSEDRAMHRPKGIWFRWAIWWAFALMALPFSAARASSQGLAKPGDGPADPKEVEEFLDSLFAEQLAALHIPGAVIVVVKDGKVLFGKGYGYADMENKRPMDHEKTVIRVGSISKLFTATAVMQLSESGKLRMDDDVNKYLHGFQLNDRFSEPITFAHLLTHTPGFDGHYIG